MTFLEALHTARSGGVEHLPIRRRGWIAGLQIWYSRSSVRWLVQSAEDGPRNLCGIPTQQCLTPETMLAEDWEVIGEER